MLKNKIIFTTIAVISTLSIQGCGGGDANESTIRQQPLDTSVILGQKATFSVSVNNATAPVSYQWLKNQTPIAGATNDTYTTGRVGIADDNVVYSVRLTIADTPINSKAAKLTVISKNVITEHFDGKSIEGVELERVEKNLLGVDAQGAAYVLKQGLRVVKLAPDGTQLPFGDSPDGVLAAQVNKNPNRDCLYEIVGGAVDAQGNVYVWHNTSETYTINGCKPTGGAINKISADGKSNTVLAQFSANEPIAPLSVHPTTTGDVYFRSAFGPRLFKIGSSGIVSAISNLGYENYVSSYFANSPSGLPEVTVDDASQVYLASRGDFFKLGGNGELISLSGINLKPYQNTNPNGSHAVKQLQWNTESKKILTLLTSSYTSVDTGTVVTTESNILLSVDPRSKNVSTIAGAPTASAGDQISIGLLPGKLGGVTKFVDGWDGNVYLETHVSPGIIKIYKILQ